VGEHARHDHLSIHKLVVTHMSMNDCLLQVQRLNKIILCPSECCQLLHIICPSCSDLIDSQQRAWSALRHLVKTSILLDIPRNLRKSLDEKVRSWSVAVGSNLSRFVTAIKTKVWTPRVSVLGYLLPLVVATMDAEEVASPPPTINPDACPLS
jgi:hypothetical protein